MTPEERAKEVYTFLIAICDSEEDAAQDVEAVALAIRQAIAEERAEIAALKAELETAKAEKLSPKHL